VTRRKPKVVAPAPEAEAPAPAAKPAVKTLAELMRGTLTMPLGPQGERAPLMPHISKADLAERFRPAMPPPGVLPRGKRLALDSFNPEFNGWVAGAQYSWAFVEGYTFLGYPYLSQLSNIAEYRLLGSTVAEEATRKWIKIKSKDGQKSKASKIEELEKELERLGVREAFKLISEQDSWFGRSHLYLDTGATDDPKELKKPLGDGGTLTATKLHPTGFKKGRRGKLRALKVVEPVWCYPARYDASDPLKDNWYRPDTWFVNGKEVHVSRLLVFVGRPVSDLLKPSFSFGGLSLSQLAKPYVDNWLQTRQSVNDLIQAFSTMVLMTDLAGLLQTGGQELDKRIALFNQYRNNRGVMALSKTDEDFKNVSAPLGGLDKLQAQAQEHICSVGQIPLVKYTGISPSGLNASSEGEIRVFYDREHAYQESFMDPHLGTVFKLAQVNIWGEADDDIIYEWEPLHELTELQLAELHERNAKADQTLIDAGTLDPSESRKRLSEDPAQRYGDLDPDDLPEPELEPGNITEKFQEEGSEALGSAPRPNPSPKAPAAKKPATVKKD
jgi:phage-related protein (TIGR01555 family)